MKCTSCNEDLPDGSNFCANCGSVIVPFVSQQTELLNTKIPVRIADISVRFEEKIGKSDWLTGNKNIVLQKFTVYFQLSDENNKTSFNNLHSLLRNILWCTVYILLQRWLQGCQLPQWLLL